MSNLLSQTRGLSSFETGSSTGRDGDTESLFGEEAMRKEMWDFGSETAGGVFSEAQLCERFHFVIAKRVSCAFGFAKLQPFSKRFVAVISFPFIPTHI